MTRTPLIQSALKTVRRLAFLNQGRIDLKGAHAGDPELSVKPGCALLACAFLNERVDFLKSQQISSLPILNSKKWKDGPAHVGGLLRPDLPNRLGPVLGPAWSLASTAKMPAEPRLQQFQSGGLAHAYTQRPDVSSSVASSGDADAPFAVHNSSKVSQLNNWDGLLAFYFALPVRIASAALALLKRLISFAACAHKPDLRVGDIPAPVLEVLL